MRRPRVYGGRNSTPENDPDKMMANSMDENWGIGDASLRPPSTTCCDYFLALTRHLNFRSVRAAVVIPASQATAMRCDNATNRIKSLLIVVFGIGFLSVWYQPVVGAEKVRVAFSAVSPTQGVLWVADVGGLLTKNGFSAEIIDTRAAIETLVAGEVDFAQMTGALMSSARLQGADPVMIAGVQDTLDDRLMARPTIKTMEGLKGKRIGVFRFGSAS